MNPFAAALRALLDEHGLSQAALARQLGITPQAVSSWAQGDSVPSHENVTRTEEALDVKPRGSLVALAGYHTDRNDDGPTVESLLRADPGLDPEDKRALLRLLALARARHADQVPYPVDLDDPNERRIWDGKGFTDAQKWRWILEYRELRDGSDGAEVGPD